MSRLPSLFISHGSPMTALQPGQVGSQLHQLAASLAKPKAIVLASAHWLTASAQVGAASQPDTMHDFRGFPPALYQLQYPAPGAPVLAQEVCNRLRHAGLHATLDAHRGLDHGVWVPLRLLYPAAEIPVIPLSIQAQQDPSYHWAMGQALASLRDEGVLLIGSGSITHNLGDLGAGYSPQQPAPYVQPFTHWIEQALARDDIAALLDYRRQAPYAMQAHPSDEHLLPLYFAMGAAGTKPLQAHRIDAGIDLGMLAMDIYRFDGVPGQQESV